MNNDNTYYQKKKKEKILENKQKIVIFMKELKNKHKTLTRTCLVGFGRYHYDKFNTDQLSINQYSNQNKHNNLRILKCKIIKI